MSGGISRVDDMDRDLARQNLIVRALSYQASQMDWELHPENPHGDAEMELKTEMLDEAAVRFVIIMTPKQITEIYARVNRPVVPIDQDTQAIQESSLSERYPF